MELKYMYNIVLFITLLHDLVTTMHPSVLFLGSCPHYDRIIEILPCLLSSTRK